MVRRFLIALLALPFAPLAANATVTEYTRAAGSWLGVSPTAEGHSFDQFYPGIASGGGCLSSVGSTVTLALGGGIATLWAFDGATPKCAITDASTGPRVSDGNLLTSGTRLVMAFDPPIFAFYAFFGSLPAGQTATMSLYAGGALEASLTVPGVHATDAVGHGFTSTVAIDSIAFTATDPAVLGAFANLASGEPSLGTDLIPAYGSSVQRDFACVFSVTVSVGNAQVSEGNAGTTPLAFQVTVSGPMALPVTVGYATANGSATLADNDYAATSGTLVIVPPAPEFLLKWAIVGPRALAADGSGNLYAVTATPIVRKFTNSGVFVTEWGSQGSGDGQFSDPYGIAVDAAGNVYVADTGNNRIQKFTSGGVFVTKWGSNGAGNGQFSAPFGVAVDASGYVYVVDDGNYRVQKFTGGGTFVTKWGTAGTGNGQFVNATAIGVDGSGNVYVTDRAVFYQSVQKFTSDGAFVTKWGSNGTGDGQFDGLWGVAADGAGFVYVSDQGNARIQKFTADGVFVTKWGSPGTADGEFAANLGNVEVDGAGNVYVADLFNSRIQKFRPVTPTGAITVNVSGDLDYELDETLHVDLSSSVNASIGVARGTGTIENDDGTTAVGDLPVTEFAIARVAPNPSAGRVMIEYTVARETQVRLAVYDVQGRRVAVLADAVRPVGRYQAVWTGQSKGGRAEAGIYFVSYRAAGKTMTRKVVLAR